MAAVDDVQVEGDHASQLTFDITSQDVGYDPGWSGQPDVSVPNLWVAVTDNDGGLQQEVARWEFDTANVNVSARTVNDSVGDFEATLDYDSDYKVPTLFEKAGDYQAFQCVLQEAQSRISLPILSFCLMPNHWHFVVQPRTDQQVTDFFRWLTHTHTMRWHAHHHTSGTGQSRSMRLTMGQKFVSLVDVAGAWVRTGTNTWQIGARS